jgi:hypothetical protein
MRLGALALAQAARKSRGRGICCGKGRRRWTCVRRNLPEGSRKPRRFPLWMKHAEMRILELQKQYRVHTVRD